MLALKWYGEETFPFGGETYVPFFSFTYHVQKLISNPLSQFAVFRSTRHHNETVEWLQI